MHNFLKLTNNFRSEIHSIFQDYFSISLPPHEAPPHTRRGFMGGVNISFHQIKICTKNYSIHSLLYPIGFVIIIHVHRSIALFKSIFLFQINDCQKSFNYHPSNQNNQKYV